MELTKDNIQEWKAILRKEMLRQYEVDGYDETYSDEEWLDEYEGATPQNAISDEVDNWSD